MKSCVAHIRNLPSQLPFTLISSWSIVQKEIPAFAGMTPPPEKVSSITRKPFQRNTSFLKPTKEAIRNLFSQLPFTPPKRIVIPVFADESNQIPGSVIIESEKRKLSSQTPALLVPHKPGWQSPYIKCTPFITPCSIVSDMAGTQINQQTICQFANCQLILPFPN